MRPVAPSSFYTPYVWAGATTYPASPASAWASQPLKSAPLTLYFTPGETAKAEEMNHVLNKLSDDQSNVQDYFDTVLDFIGQIQLQNWPYNMSAYFPGGSLGGGLVTKPYWSDYHGCWLYIRRRYQALYSPTDYDEPEINVDGGAINDGEANTGALGFIGSLDVQNGGPINTQSVRAWAIAANPTGEVFVIASDGNVYFGTSFGSNNLTQLNVNAGEQSELHYFGGRFVLFAGKGSHTQAQYVTSVAGDGTAWNAAQNVTAALQPCDGWAVATSPDRLIAVPTTLTNVFTYLKMDTSHTVTYGAIGSPPAGYRHRCIAYAGDNIWYATLDNNSNTTNIYKSVDNGDTWTLVKTMSKLILYMAGNGGGTVLALYGSSGDQALWSKDGTTWYRAPTRMQFVPGVTSASRTVKPCIGVAAHQLVIANYQGLNASVIAGLPSAGDTY